MKEIQTVKLFLNTAQYETQMNYFVYSINMYIAILFQT